MLVFVCVATIVAIAHAQLEDPGSQAATVCSANPRMDFRSSVALGGFPSYISSAGSTVPYVKNVPFQPIVIDVQDIPDGTVISISVEPPVLCTGDTAEVIGQQAIFDAFTVADDIPWNTSSASVSTARLQFTAALFDAVGVELGRVYLDGGQLHTLNESETSTPSFARLLHYGALRHSTPADVPSGETMGDFYIGVYDAIGRVVATDAAISVAVAPGNVFGLLQPVGPVFTGRGIVTMAGLNYTIVDEPNSTTFRFSVKCDGWSYLFDSPLVTPRAPGFSNDFAEFDPDLSFIREDNIGSTAVLGVDLPPVVINLLSSSRQRDSSNTGLVVRASTSQGQIRGNMALVVRGVATFNNLAFVGDTVPRAAVIRFSVSPSEGRDLVLFSGAIEVARTVIHAKHFVFAPWSDLNARSSRQLIVNDSGPVQIVSVPLVAVRLLNSAFALDPEAGPFDAELLVDPPGLLVALRGSRTLVAFGAGAFPAAVFQLTEAATQRTTGFTVRFIVRDLSLGNATQGPRTDLSTGDIFVVPSSAAQTRHHSSITLALAECAVTPKSDSCEYDLKFDAAGGGARSAVFEADGALTGTAGSPLATIRIELIDRFGSLASGMNGAPTLVAHTSEEPTLTDSLLASTGTQSALKFDGFFEFSCLRFLTSPSTLVRLRFTARDSKGAWLRALTVRTGFVRIASAPTSYFGLRIARSLPPQYPVVPGAAVAEAGQRSTAVVGVTLPPIVVEVTDSLGVLDSGTDSIPLTIVALPTTGQSSLLLGASAAVRNGLAIFDGLRFSAVSDDVALTFTANMAPEATEVLPVAGSSVLTGSFKVTVAPQPLSHMFFGPLPSNYVLPRGSVLLTKPYEATTFANLSDVSVTVVLRFRDSAHRPVTARSQSEGGLHNGVLHGLEVRVTSAVFDVEQTANDPDPSCGCLMLTIRPRSWKSSATAGAPAYVSFSVSAVGPRGDPAMIGQTLTVGPISVVSEANPDACAAGTASAFVYAEYQVPLLSFDSTKAERQLAYVMALETDRVTIDKQLGVPVDRKDHDSLAPWTGVRVPVRFSDPRPSDRNRQPGSVLAAALTSLEPDCTAPDLLLRSAYFPEPDRSCKSDAFDRAAAQSRQCMRQGLQGACECWAQNLFADAGPRCIRERQSDLQTICLEMSSCSDAQISAVCDQVPEKVQNLTGMYVSIVAVLVGGVGGGIFVIRRRAASIATTRTLASSSGK